MVRKNFKKQYSNKRVRKVTHSSTLTFEKKQMYAGIEFLIVICIGVFILLLVSFLLIFLLYSLQRSQYFAVQQIDIKGNKRLSTNHVMALSGVNIGDNILCIRLGSVYEKLYQSKWIKRVAVRKTLPDTIHIDIEELQASFWIQHDNTLYYADALGLPITPVDKTFFVSLPVLEIEKGAEDFVIHLPAIMQELHKTTYPLDLKSISWIKLLSTATVQFFIESSNLTVTIAIEGWRENIKRAQLVIHDLARRSQLTNVRKIYANNVVLVEM